MLVTNALAEEMQNRWVEKNDVLNAAAKRSRLLKI